MELIDTHAHLDFSRFNQDREEVIARAREEGINVIIDVGADLASSRRAVALSREYQGIYAVVGIHPHDADQLDVKSLQAIEELTGSEKVVAVGEVGLDYHYDNSPRPVQREAFRQQLELAYRVNLPYVIHSREADTDTLKILEEMPRGGPDGILHCFGSDLEMARSCLDLGLYLAFGGVTTFHNARTLQQVVKEVPLEKILLETDSPYLTPYPHRGQRNEPAFVRYVAEKVAKLKGISLEEVAEQTSYNARQAFRLD